MVILNYLIVYFSLVRLHHVLQVLNFSSVRYDQLVLVWVVLKI